MDKDMIFFHFLSACLLAFAQPELEGITKNKHDMQIDLATENRSWKELARSSGYLSAVTKKGESLEGASCNLTTVSEDTVITNFHCVNFQEANLYANFDQTSEGPQKTYACNTFVAGSENLDYAILKCDNSPGKDVGISAVDYKKKDFSQPNEILYWHHNCFVTESESSCRKKNMMASGNAQGLNEKLNVTSSSGKTVSSYGNIQTNIKVRKGTSGTAVRDPATGKIIGLVKISHSGKAMLVPMDLILRDLKKRNREAWNKLQTEAVAPEKKFKEKVGLQGFSEKFYSVPEKNDEADWTTAPTVPGL